MGSFLELHKPIPTVIKFWQVPTKQSKEFLRKIKLITVKVKGRMRRPTKVTIVRKRINFWNVKLIKLLHMPKVAVIL